MTHAPERPFKPTPAQEPDAVRVGLHPRNAHQGRYDFARLTARCPQLSAFVVIGPGGEPSVDFADPDAVRALNRALLSADYGIAHWDLPEGYLCPPIPGRADYLHGLADLLAADAGGVVPRGPTVRALDIGVGANCIYPLLGHADYGWRFVGADVDEAALAAADATVRANGLGHAIELRHQPARGSIFAGVLRDDETFDLSLCNPPFHASAEDAARASGRKWRNLGKLGAARFLTEVNKLGAARFLTEVNKPGAARFSTEVNKPGAAGFSTEVNKPGATRSPPRLNFGGQATELWCTGGEASFLRRMIRESAGIADRVAWFSSLVSRSENLPGVRRQLEKAGALATREVAMAQGSKQSRFVAWTFLDPDRRALARSARVAAAALAAGGGRDHNAR